MAIMEKIYYFEEVIIMFKKVAVTKLDACVIYACAVFLTYLVGGISYNLGKQDGKKEEL